MALLSEQVRRFGDLEKAVEKREWIVTWERLLAVLEKENDRVAAPKVLREQTPYKVNGDPVVSRYEMTRWMLMLKRSFGGMGVPRI